MNSRYYISTGSKTNYYTLRHSFDEAAGPDGETVTRDYHVRNLSVNKGDAVAKARALGHDLDADFDVLPIGESKDIDWSILQSGKYAGQSIHEVRETDTKYLVWLCQYCDKRSAYAKTVELAKALVASELAVAQDERDAVDAERQARIALFAPIAARFDMEFPVYVESGYHKWEYVGHDRNGFVDDVVASLRRGDFITPYAAEIVVDKVAKLNGRRNSKAYNLMVDELSDFIAPAVKG
jgi:hypothetical protein